MYDNILFDLDGTLTESAEGITNSVIFALDKMGIKETDKEKLKAFVGPPLDESFMKHYGFDKETAKEAIENYRIYYREKGIFEAPLYANVEKTLVQLKEDGKRLFVATSKPEVFARQILEHWEIAHLFTDIVGSNLDGSKINKDEVIASLFERNGITDKAKVVMVGDRKHDVLGAKKVGVASVGVLYGYGDDDELNNAGADYLIKSIEELIQVLNIEENNTTREEVMFYHASSIAGIKELIPNISNHKKPLVYLTTKRENTLVYLSNAVEKYCKEIGFEHSGSYYKWASYGFSKEGILELQEYWENAIEDTYAGVSGYIYSMREVSEPEKLGDIPFAVTSNMPVQVEYCEYIPDAYEAIKEAADKGLILLRRFNENSEKKMQWIEQCIKAEYIKAQQFPEYKVFLEAKFKEVLK